MENLRAQALSYHQILIEWDEYTYTSNGNPVQGFQVCLSKAIDPTACEILVGVDISENSYSRPFLTTFTRYYISVRVMLANGDQSDRVFTDAMTLERGKSYSANFRH